MKPSVAKRYRRMVDGAAIRCREPVVAVLTCQHVGAYGRALGAIGGLASFKSRSASKAAGGLPDNVLLALTCTRLYAFGFRPTMSGVKLGNALAGGAARAGRPRQNGDCRSGCAATGVQPYAPCRSSRVRYKPGWQEQPQASPALHGLITPFQFRDKFLNAFQFLRRQ